MSEELLVVGKRLVRPDAMEKATGAAKYGGDIKLPRMLMGKVLRSPYPHAKILKIDKSKAERLPGVEAVITLEDVPRIMYSEALTDLPSARSGAVQRPDQYIFADKARFVGDAIAAVAAINESIAEEALELIEVEYEQLPAVFDPIEAMKPGAPRVHDSVEGNIAAHVVYPLSRGDVEKAFQEADCVVENSFRTTRQAHCILDTESSTASFDAAGRLTLWSANQRVHVARRAIAHIFGMPIGMVRVLSPSIGGAFGRRISMGTEPVCVALAKKAGKPVKLELSKEEDFTALETRPAFTYNAKLGFKKDGTLTAIQVKVVTHAGGYLANSASVTAMFLAFGLGHYRCPNAAGEADVVYTNNSPSGAFRGFGNPESMWGIEQLMDMAAEKLGIDPTEIRLRNIKKVGEAGNLGVPIQSTALETCIKVGAERTGWKEKRARKGDRVTRRGVGMATMSHCSGAYPALLEHTNAFIKLDEDGSASLMVHPCEMGQGPWGVLAQIAAEELGLRAEDVQVVMGDTDVTMFDVGSKASRVTYVMGNAVLIAARQAKQQLVERAAKALKVSADELEVKDRRVYVKVAPENSISVADVVRDAIYNFKGECLNISGKCSFEPTTASPPTQALFTEVEVNTETGRVKVLKIVIANDNGRSINPTSVEGQLEGGVQQGLGYGLTEDLIINKDTGVVESNNFDTYKMPGILDMPEIEITLIEEPDPVGPFGAKGVGEAGLIAIAPAIANAIYNAVGVQITGLPIGPEKLLNALEAKG